MKFVRTIVFVLLFATVTVIYIYQTRLAKQVLTNVPDEVNRNIVLSQKDVIDRVELRDHVQKTQIALRKKKEGWKLELPVRYPAENQIAEGFAIAARMASRQPRLQAEKDWEEYGLAKPEFEILFDIAGEKEATLLIGAQTPIGNSVFARWKGERGYFLLPREMKAMFRQSVYALREKRIFRAPPETFNKIYMEMGERSYQWKKDGDDWYWFEPVEKFGQKVDPEQMNAVLAVLQNLHAREFHDNNKKSRAELGFFMIHDRIRVDSEGDKTEQLHFGNEVPDRNAYYGFREGEETVFWVDRQKVIEVFDLMRAIQKYNESQAGENPKLETKDLSPKPVMPGS
jgi:hypothetical protein